MKKIVIGWMISFVLIACTNSTEEKNKTVDTTIVGSDNPTPSPDTTGIHKGDSLEK